MQGIRSNFNVTLIVALITAMSLIMAGPASASAVLVAAVEGTASLDGGTPGSGQGDFVGTWDGLHGTDAGVADLVKADRFNYANDDIVLGTADGVLDFYIDGDVVHSDNFTWVRVGLTAVITFGNGLTAIAVFAPIATTNDAVVVGFGVGLT